jgi:hypothetical protein
VDVFAVPVMVVMMDVFVAHRFVYQLQHRPAAEWIRRRGACVTRC